MKMCTNRMNERANERTSESAEKGEEQRRRLGKNYVAMSTWRTSSLLTGYGVVVKVMLVVAPVATECGAGSFYSTIRGHTMDHC